MSAKAWISSAALLAAVACTSSRSGGDPSAPAVAGSKVCDPLSVTAEPIALVDVLAAGKSADGTVFVIDRGDRFGGHRAFVSDGTLLRRHQIVGSGETADFVSVQLDDPNGIMVRVDLVNGAVTRMGISGQRDPNSKTFEIDDAEELTLMPLSELSSFQVANIASVGIMYAATTLDGHRFYAFEPKVDRRDGDVRVFYGTVDRMVERRVLSESRDLTVHLEIDLEGTRTNVQLNFCSVNPAFGPTRLEPAGGPAIPLTPIPGSPGGVRCPSFGTDGGLPEDGGAALPDAPAPPEALVAGLTFVCF